MHKARAPLAEAGLTKAEIRALAREAGLKLWDKPASACLASRIEYGRRVTLENLSQVEKAEAALHGLGFPQVRVRHHGELARIEIVRPDLPRALDMDALDAITGAVRAAGFLYVTLDTQGYRSGSMNEALSEAAGCLILEDEEHTRQRGAKIYGRLLGGGRCRNEERRSNDQRC